MKGVTELCLTGFPPDWRNIPSGAPQMSIIGPLLFLTFINDIEDNISIATTKNHPLRRWH